MGAASTGPGPKGVGGADVTNVIRQRVQAFCSVIRLAQQFAGDAVHDRGLEFGDDLALRWAIEAVQLG